MILGFLLDDSKYLKTAFTLGDNGKEVQVVMFTADYVQITLVHVLL